MQLKEALLQECEQFVDKRLQNIKQMIESHQKDLQSETKSSAGDKHETGRAMLQLEMEKAGQQLANVQQMTETISKIDVTKTTNIAHLGSVIQTKKTNYFLSISAGQIQVQGKYFFAISTHSPIGKLFLGKKAKDEIYLNGNRIEILEIF